MFYRLRAITEDLKPMAKQGYMAGLLTSHRTSMFRRPPDTGHLRLSTGSSRLAKVQDLHMAFSSTLSPPRGRRLSDGKRDILHLLARQHTKAAVSILLQMPWPYERQAKAIWRFLGADPTLAREVLHILLCVSPEKGQTNARQSQDRSYPQPAQLPPAGHGDPPKAGPEEHPVAPPSRPPGQPGG
ncbi:uncharacterized protein LOC123364118 isoform X2 [Mauremys mutica]|nr:uncharacterized protein LOC123364118 isoform X2 [Mauremys mutica]XP_044861878.1 uncharacterized protein LOC123364118 isoform X2 [Mauremys mutica]XP_044861879.1 uncharacterized protein LOC123364118 isoform X2 [Mauremys mutica]XP_044861880.1 uncharacterized protein LOC123364118 isoform X2 [Mauremys mutica]XP_044861881.1 uncharacterized protein LOC123364118 isoform X2 [Mauremys mutica]XP_044861882.1 uncharacterized protein LOC123364118 isoform X2 [Mauremys mutica]XP_044861883.1 uncharacterize